MKKVIKFIVLSLTLYLLSLFMIGCSLFINKEKVGEGYSQSTLTLYDGENATQYVAKYGTKVSITITATKKGYYFEGYYDAEEGGIKYIDGDGNSLVKWEQSFPTILYARWGDISTLLQEINVFDNEPQDGGFSGQRTAIVKLNKEFNSALKSNFNEKIKIEYSIDLKIGNGWTASPIGMYVKGYDNSGAKRYTVFTHTPTVGEFSTFTGNVEITASDFVDGNIYIVVWNTKKQMGAWAYPVYYSRNLTLKISFVAE
ncbi:MAG: hypothetical protein E7350_00205 [Clostridiales bacterium]|nr:hypothetical protein [Clostridiales bacterium]